MHAHDCSCFQWRHRRFMWICNLPQQVVHIHKNFFLKKERNIKHSARVFLWTASRVGFSNSQVWENRLSWNYITSPLTKLEGCQWRLWGTSSTGLLFLMCSAYTAMSHHASPGSLHTHSPFYCPLGLACISCKVWLYPKIHFNWASGSFSHLLILFLLSQTV